MRWAIQFCPDPAETVLQVQACPFTSCAPHRRGPDRGAGPVGDVSSLFTVGGVLFGAGVVQVPAWARRRRRQFEDIASRLSRAIRS